MRTTIEDQELATGATQMILGNTPDLEKSHKNCSDPARKDSWSCSSLGYGAAECNLYPCAKSYKADVKDGNLVESITSEWKLYPTPNGDLLNVVRLDCLSKQAIESLIGADYRLDQESQWFNYNGPVKPQSGPMAATNDALGNSLANIVSSLMIPFLTGLVINRTTTFDNPSVLQAFYNDGNISLSRVDAMFKNLSLSMTVYIRQHSDPTFSAQAVGQVLIQETCVNVRWPWLTFPAVLVCLTVLFFFAMVYETRTGSQANHGWKSSPLPLLFHGMDSETQERHSYGDVYQIKDMKANAGELHMRLDATEKGLKFTEVEIDHPENSRAGSLEAPLQV
ncbi:hypothetical protein EPUS_06720 [Endocarpon pusillum Z07020]|uniref:Uncharacterized protein n=1 Tax=Endocarpon pusillum (strain Z07020 / HMAS-L-300199) TaxID=1263415 RepID=U1HKZ3_ENDPU|nr:uncharacterized protein EPUS_06720 [Endocarpon pusillum Z07020]ERF70935.1 hypothetical protein EPUS_06720 [Endocarpon pusillum Z07020]